jgi:hypothetical protein
MPKHEEVVVDEAKKQLVQKNHRVRQMRESDVQECLAIFRDHGLACSKYGLKTFRSLEPAGCFVLTPDNNENEIIAFSASSKFDPRAAIISFYGVKPGYQGLGLGVIVWKEMMKFLSSSPNIGLCSSPSQVNTYKNKAGFVHQDKHSMIHMESRRETRPDRIKPSDEEMKRIHVVSLDDVSWSSLVAYDEAIVGFDREKQLKLSFREPDTVSLVAVDASSFSPNYKIIGLAAMKPTNTLDEKPILGPLYADDVSVARVLLYNLMNKYPSSIKNGFMWYLLNTHSTAIHLAKELGLDEDFACPRLFTKEPITGINYDKVFALLSPAFAPY